jgi:hypothetical protein
MDSQLNLSRTMDGGLRDYGLTDEPDIGASLPIPVARRVIGSIDSEVLSLSAETLAERLGIAIQTAREWRRLGRIPAPMLRSARALVQGDLGVIDDAWRGWTISSGVLRSPDGGDYVFRTADVMSLPYTRRRLAEAQSQLEAARRPPTPPEPLTQQSDWISQKWAENTLSGPDAENARLDALLRERAQKNSGYYEQMAQRRKRW